MNYFSLHLVTFLDRLNHHIVTYTNITFISNCFSLNSVTVSVLLVAVLNYFITSDDREGGGGGSKNYNTQTKIIIIIMGQTAQAHTSLRMFHAAF